jgi:hypothetical protein
MYWHQANTGRIERRGPQNKQHPGWEGEAGRGVWQIRGARRKAKGATGAAGQLGSAGPHSPPLCGCAAIFMIFSRNFNGLHGECACLRGARASPKGCVLPQHPRHRAPRNFELAPAPSGQRQDPQTTAPPSERKGGQDTRHFARWKQISR